MKKKPLLPTSNMQALYFFGECDATGSENILGNKGAALAEMARLGLPVPFGFTLTTDACAKFLADEALFGQVLDAVALLGQKSGECFGSIETPLFLSVRSGAAISMPGMMDTILNIGINDEIAAAFRQNGEFICDSYCRLIQMYAEIVMQAGGAFNAALAKHHKRDYLAYKECFRQVTGQDFPQDVTLQLKQAIVAVLRSWQNARAVAYRQMNNISGDAVGTALNIQKMVFGNKGHNSGTGVIFTRNPNDGSKQLYGEFITKAQGEDIVAGTHTPQPLYNLAASFPNVYHQLQELCQKLEMHYRDMQDIEFTFEDGKLWLLQTRCGKRAAAAAVQIAVDLANEGAISKKEAVGRVAPHIISQLLHPVIASHVEYKSFATGLPASPGAANGAIVFSAAEAIAAAAAGKKVILVRAETTADDVAGMSAAQGVITASGGMTSHAAVVARGMGKPCITAANIAIDYAKQQFTAETICINAGNIITINGNTGELILGEMPLQAAHLPNSLQELLSWADALGDIKVRANCETAAEAQIAKQFGAQGIGLCRTEHMFFAPERIDIMRQMILAKDFAARQQALEHLLPYQVADFKKLLTIMAGHPVTIRLLDPPLHEFLSGEAKEIERLAAILQENPANIQAAIEKCLEKNPMLGHRGCRLAISHPEIYHMQVRAIFMAYIELQLVGISPTIEIMVPFIIDAQELKIIKADIASLAVQLEAATNVKINYSVGTMIELPRAALLAGEIAREADFLSFGTNDLTQSTLGISRDDAMKFLPTYIQKNILPCDPFVSLDEKGVGLLMSMAVQQARQQKSDIKIGICGEHGGDAASILFCHKLGVDYISCSSFRVLAARLTIGQIC